MKNLSPEVRGILLTLFAVSCFGIMDGLSKFLVTLYPTPFVLWIRHLAGVPLVLLVLGLRRIPSLARSARPALQAGRAILLVVQMGLVMICFRLLPLADVHSIMAATPLIVTALSMPLLGEQVGWRRWVAVGIGFVGVLVIVRPGLTTVHPALLIAVVGTFMNAVYNILTRKAACYDRSETSWLWQSLVAAAALTLVGPFYWVTPEPRHWALLLMLAALAAIGHYSLVRALSLAPAVVVQPFTYTQLVWGIIIGYLVFADLPDRFTIGGAAMIISAGIYAAWREHVRQNRTT